MNPYFEPSDVVGLIPLATCVVFGVFALLLEVFQRPSHPRDYIATISAAGFGLAGVFAFMLTDADVRPIFGGIAILDPYAAWTAVILCLGGAITSLSASDWLADQGLDRGEFYALLQFAVAGLIGMTLAADLIVLFVSIEIASVAAYALAAFLRTSGQSAEAGFKYFAIGALGSAVLLYGIALVYGATGTTTYAAIAQAIAGNGQGAAFAAGAAHEAMIAAAAGRDVANGMWMLNIGGSTLFVPLAVVGMALILSAFAVKVAAAPFHFWAPDVYTGAPTPAAGFLASVVKVGGIAALLRLLTSAFWDPSVRVGDYGWSTLVILLAVMSVGIGNLVAITQTRLKRVLGFSSVAHAGYLLLGVAAVGMGPGAPGFGGAVVFYLLAYTVATTGTFAVLSSLGRRGHEADQVDDLNGLAQRSPWLAAALSLFLLSSAGIPPAAGFLAKFMVLRGAIGSFSLTAEFGGEGAMLMLVAAVFALVASVAGAFYYLRLIALMYMGQARREVAVTYAPRTQVAIAIAALLTLVLGLMPGQAAIAADDAFLGMLRPGTELPNAGE